METDAQDKLARALARLKALKGQLHPTVYGKEYLGQYNAALNSISEAGFDVTEFRFSGRTQPDVDGRLLIMHIDTVLGYFEIKLATPPNKPGIGFKGPKKE